MVNVIEYVREDGTSPFTSWFEDLDEAAAAKVTTALNRMALGNPGDTAPVGHGVSERRIFFGPGYRIYYGKDGDQLVILLTGGTKKRQQDDIADAHFYWAEYKRRKAEEQSENADP